MPQCEARDENMAHTLGNSKARMHDVASPEDGSARRRPEHERGRRDTRDVGLELARPKRGAAPAKVDIWPRERHKDTECLAIGVRLESAARGVTVDVRLIPAEFDGHVGEMLWEAAATLWKDLFDEVGPSCAGDSTARGS